MSDMIVWSCPKCSVKNYDFKDQGTYCGNCGRVVWVGNQDGQYWDEGWNVFDSSVCEPSELKYVK